MPCPAPAALSPAPANGTAAKAAWGAAAEEEGAAAAGGGASRAAFALRAPAPGAPPLGPPAAADPLISSCGRMAGGGKGEGKGEGKRRVVRLGRLGWWVRRYLVGVGRIWVNGRGGGRMHVSCAGGIERI